MSILVCTLMTGAVFEYGKYSAKINEAYCKKHGYDWYVETELINKKYHPYWNKLLLIESNLVFSACRWDYVMFIDADACFTNFDITLDKFIDPVRPVTVAYQNKDLYKGPLGMNSGVMLFKNCKESTDYLVEAFDLFEACKKDPCPEQLALGRLADGKYKDIVKRVSCKDFNAYRGPFAERQNLPHCMWEPGDFIMHCLRCSAEYRINAFKKVIENERLGS